MLPPPLTLLVQCRTCFTVSSLATAAARIARKNKADTGTAILAPGGRGSVIELTGEALSLLWGFGRNPQIQCVDWT